jgi:hypothetical protein
MVQKNRNSITGKFVTASYARKTPPNDSQGVPKPLHSAQKSDHTVRETVQVIKKGEWPVKLEGPLTKKVRHAVI